MNNLNLVLEQNIILFHNEVNVLYGVAGNYYFYIEKNKKERDKLIFSLVDCNNTVLNDLKELNFDFIESIDTCGDIILDIDYLFLTDDQLLYEIVKITDIFKKHSILQKCEISNVNQNFFLYNLDTRLAIISEVVFKERFQGLKIKKENKSVQRFVIALICLFPMWKIIGLASYPHILGNINLYSNSFEYSSGPTVFAFFLSFIFILILYVLFDSVVKNKGRAMLIIPTGLLIILISVYIASGISIHRAFRLDISIFSILFGTYELYEATGLEVFLYQELISAGSGALLAFVLPLAIHFQNRKLNKKPISN